MLNKVELMLLCAIACCFSISFVDVVAFREELLELSGCTGQEFWRSYSKNKSKLAGCMVGSVLWRSYSCKVYLWWDSKTQNSRHLYCSEVASVAAAAALFSMRMRGISQRWRHGAGSCGGIQRRWHRASCYEVSGGGNEFHITGSASAAVYGGGIPRIIQTNPIQLFDFVSDLFDFRSQLSASPTCSTWL